MKKIALILSLACLSLACAKEAQNPDSLQTEKQVNLQQVTLVAGQEVATKTDFNKDTGALTWKDSGEESDMAIFDGSAKQLFTHGTTTDGGTQATFSGTADVSTATWVAVHPASHAALDGANILVTFPCFQTIESGGGMQSDVNTMAAQLTHDGSGNLDHFTMKNVGGLLKLTVAKDGIKTITVSSRGGEALTGTATLTFDGEGNPVLTPVSTKYETFVTLCAANMATGIPTGDYFVNVFPATLASGILIDMENIDGIVASVKSSTAATVTRSADLEFAGFDTGASWYEPETTTISLDFQPSWPFDEAITSSSADGAVWAGDGEKQMTLTTDKSIKFFLHCTNWATAKSSGNGMRFGMGKGDYLLFPAIPGKNLCKVVVRHSQNDNSNPAIMTRGGNEVVEGGTAEGNASQNGEYTWNLVGTAHNMQYRYQLTKSSLAFVGSLELTYASKPADVVILDLQFYNSSTNTALNPFNNVDRTPKLDTWGTQITPTTPEIYVFTSGDKDYEFVFNGGKAKIARAADKRGLGLSSCALKLPTISGYKLTNIKTALGGQAANQTDADPSVDPKNFYLSTSTSKADQVWKHSFAASSMATLPTVDDDLTSTVAETDYYLVTEWGWCYLQYLTLTYTAVSSAPAPAPASLLDGGETEL